MKVVDLHPEDLLDKLSAGSLSSAEQGRLDAHLAQCDACRFELSVRDDFAEDAPLVDQRPQLTFPSASPMKQVSERTRPLAPSPRVTASMRARSRRRWPLAMVAAALLLCAGGATAAVVSGAVPAPWLPWAPAPSSGPSDAATSHGAADAKAHRKPKRVAAKPAVSSAPGTPIVDQPAAEVVSAAPPTELLAAPAEARVVSAPPRAPVAHASSSGNSPASAAFAPLPSAALPALRAEDAKPSLDPAAALFADANRARRDGNADRAVMLYRSLQGRYPGSSESELSRALLAQLLLDRGSPEAALAGFDRYLAEGAPVLGAEALVGRARALEQLGRTAQAAAAWREVQSRFAGSVHARLAATRLAALGTR